MNIDSRMGIYGNMAAESNHYHAVAGDWKKNNPEKK
jgi:hypothetical protein